MKTHTHTHTNPFNGPFSRTTQVSRYQKGKTNLDFTEARDSEWQWHQLGHMQVCTLLQIDNHTSTRPLFFYRLDALPAAQPTASKHWRHILCLCVFPLHYHTVGLLYWSSIHCCFIWTVGQGVHMHALLMVQYLSVCLPLRIGCSCCCIWWLSCKHCAWLLSANHSCWQSSLLNHRNLWALIIFHVVHLLLSDVCCYNV